MRRILGVMVAVLVLSATGARAGVLDEVPLDTPDSFGDQVIYYYDARADFTTFLTIRVVPPDVPATVSVLFYEPTIGTPFSKVVTVAAGGLTTIDVGALRDNGLPAQAGVAMATVLNGTGQTISSNALSGNFTVANLLTGSAFGAPAAARSAFDADGNILPLGSVLGPGTGVLQRIRQNTALLAAYYDPNSLAPASAGAISSSSSTSRIRTSRRTAPRSG